MEICIEKIGMIRPFTNPKNCDVNLEMDWSIDYYDTVHNRKKYVCILRSLNSLNLNLKIEGVLVFDDSEEFINDLCSQVILDNSYNLLMKIFSLTRESNYNFSEIGSNDYFVDEDVHTTLFN